MVAKKVGIVILYGNQWRFRFRFPKFGKPCDQL